MTFIDTLRQSRTSRVAVLHEFWTQYNPSQERVHAFFEGHDDVSFFSHFIERYLPNAARLYVYRCEGKARVYEAFTEITARHPSTRSVLFFVDKDIDDVLGAAWPTDPRIFVTDVYSIENYIVDRVVLQRLFRDAVRVAGVTFDEDLLLSHFDRELARFQRHMLGLMAWIILAKRSGARPNVANIDLSRLYGVNEACRVVRVSRSRLDHLTRVTGLPAGHHTVRQLSQVTRELARLPAKRVVRGKFEAWFFVEFWKVFISQLRALAREGGGDIAVKVTLERSSFCTMLKSYVDVPRGLHLFLAAHFSSDDVPPQHAVQRRGWFARLRAIFGG